MLVLSNETSITVAEDLLEDAEFCKLLFLIFGVIFRPRRDVFFPADLGDDEALSDSFSASSPEIIQNLIHYLFTFIILWIFRKKWHYQFSGITYLPFFAFACFEFRRLRASSNISGICRNE